MNVWGWRAVSLALWASWAVFLFHYGNNREWWAIVAAIVLTTAALMSLGKVWL